MPRSGQGDVCGQRGVSECIFTGWHLKNLPLWREESLLSLTLGSSVDVQDFGEPEPVVPDVVLRSHCSLLLFSHQPCCSPGASVGTSGPWHELVQSWSSRTERGRRGQ